MTRIRYWLLSTLLIAPAILWASGGIIEQPWFKSGSLISVQTTTDQVLLGTVALASLGTPANGTHVFCTDCNAGTSPCTSGGTGALAVRANAAWACPAFTSGGGGTFPPPPATQYYVNEEFNSGAAVAGQIGDLGWSFTGTVTHLNGETDHPGLWQVSTGTSSGTITRLSFFNASDNLFIPSAIFDGTWIARHTNDSATRVRIGVANSCFSDPPSDGMYFEKLSADTNYFRVTRSGGTQTRTDTTFATSTAFRRFRVRRIDGTTIGFTLDSNAEQTNTTNIPTTGMNVCFQLVNSAAANKTLDADSFQMTIAVTR